MNLHNLAFSKKRPHSGDTEGTSSKRVIRLKSVLDLRCAIEDKTHKGEQIIVGFNV